MRENLTNVAKICCILNATILLLIPIVQFVPIERGVWIFAATFGAWGSFVALVLSWIQGGRVNHAISSSAQLAPEVRQGSRAVLGMLQVPQNKTGLAGSSLPDESGFPKQT